MIDIYATDTLKKAQSEHSLQDSFLQMRYLWQGDYYNRSTIIKTAHFLFCVQNFSIRRQTFVLKDTLSNHIRMVHVEGSKSHKCEHCGKVF